MTKFIEEQIAIYQAGIAEIESRRPDLKAEDIHPSGEDEDARNLIIYRASLLTLQSTLERHRRRNGETDEHHEKSI